MAMQDANDKDIPEKELPDETELFDQLQHEFDDLVSEDTQQKAVVHADIDDMLIEPEFENSPPLFLSQSDPSAPLPDIDNIDSREGLPPPADTPATEPDDESNPLEENTPLHPDMPGTREQRQGSNHFIAISSAIVLIMVGGIYWLATSTSHQQPATVTEQPVAPDDKPSTPLPEPDTTQQAAEKRASAKKAAARKIAVIRPSTQIQEQPLELQQASATATDKPGLWIIELASVNSDKSARQHMARIRAMGVESKAVQVNDKGRVFHSIRITGFSSKSEAIKRRNILIKLLGVLAAKVEKL